MNCFFHYAPVTSGHGGIVFSGLPAVRYPSINIYLFVLARGLSCVHIMWML